jgi:hypothetical protein
MALPPKLFYRLQGFHHWYGSEAPAHQQYDKPCKSHRDQKRIPEADILDEAAEHDTLLLDGHHDVAMQQDTQRKAKHCACHREQYVFTENV